MSISFRATSTADEVLGKVDLRGRRVLVTGVSSGVGVETARVLAAHGARVVGAARDLNKARRATEQVRAQAAPGGSFDLIELDLASLASIRACADALVKAGERFDVVIANAGVMASPKGTTADGFETQFGTNHLGHFVSSTGLRASSIWVAASSWSPQPVIAAPMSISMILTSSARLTIPWWPIGGPRRRRSYSRSSSTGVTRPMASAARRCIPAPC